MELPRGVALVRANVKGRTIVLVSDRLNPTQELAARVLASALTVGGCPYISLSMQAVLAALHDATAA